jgi:phage tail P2-like protein
MSDTSSYLRHLPAEFERQAFLGRFLLAFEQILTGLGDPAYPGIEELVDGITDTQGRVLLAGMQRYFDPGPRKSDDTSATEVLNRQRAPVEFLPWLAGWLSLTLREDWDEETRRRFLSGIVPLYRKRGTKAGLREMLRLYLGQNTAIAILDDQRPGEFAFDPPAHFFQVHVTTTDITPEELQIKQRIATAIIDQEKPAHTYYALQFLMPSMRLLSKELQARIGGHMLKLGKGGNTLLGTEVPKENSEGDAP